MAALSSLKSNRSLWQTVVMFSLGFWLSGMLVLDALIMPSMYVSGMMAESEFASAGYMMFSTFNRIELLCAALALTGLLAIFKMHKDGAPRRSAIILSSILLIVASIDTYGLTPQMSALGMQLDWFSPIAETPAAMDGMHAGYWALEAVKLVFAAWVLIWCYRDRQVTSAQ
ncbi:MAG: DUF4149 domain-containing protein [Oscillatoria sp. SIO1A7]|nr:DUF4149 domain-containing protein [Oscillatoria sp. SIO1A7]